MTTTTMDGAMATPARPPRLTSVDMLRGLVIVIMALDHTRDYFHSQAFLFDPTDAGATSLAVYLTRWVTHVCAPTFVLLAGMSAFLQGQAGKGRGALARFLVSRGLWLIFLEMVLLNYGWNFTIYGFGLQVIWALGVGMIALAGLIWLPRGAVLAIGVAICAGHNLLDPVRPADLGPAAPLWVMLHEGGPTLTAFFIVYPVLPWIGVMALGYGLAPVLTWTPRRRARALIALGVAMIAAFLVLRGVNAYGDPRPWKALVEPMRRGFSFFDVTKYPPSLDYLLITLGSMLALLPAMERLKGPVARVLEVYGRAPLMFYIAHIYLLHLAMLLTGLAMGLPAQTFVWIMADPSPLIRAHWGFPLPVVYGVWIVATASLYPLCRWWGDLKRRRRDWWLSYL
ncbi:MAG TPA: heparan-alpha-glucosaminide N-acetyltransferase domain-containing protein [Caulobacter sp.]|nr:heparan-alpha-glucosaminide N-acetyltransferase domain-containing protein [Caulobacter sp.]